MFIKQIGTQFEVRWHERHWRTSVGNAAHATSLTRDLMYNAPYHKPMDDPETLRCVALLQGCAASGDYNVEAAIESEAADDTP